MAADLIEKMATAAYEEYMDGLIGCCEPRWDELPECHTDRMKASTEAGATVLLQEMMAFAKERDGWSQNTCRCTVKAFAKDHSISLNDTPE